MLIYLTACCLTAPGNTQEGYLGCPPDMFGNTHLVHQVCVVLRLICNSVCVSTCMLPKVKALRDPVLVLAGRRDVFLGITFLRNISLGIISEGHDSCCTNPSDNAAARPPPCCTCNTQLYATYLAVAGTHRLKESVSWKSDSC